MLSSSSAENVTMRVAKSRSMKMLDWLYTGEKFGLAFNFPRENYVGHGLLLFQEGFTWPMGIRPYMGINR